MEMNGGFLVTKIKQLGDRIFEKILSEKNIDAFNGAQGRILYVLWQKDGISIRSLSTKCGLAITSLTTMLERMENQGQLDILLPEASYFVATPSIEKNMYDPADDSIDILYNDGSTKNIAEASDMLNISLLSKKVKKYYLCYQRLHR